MSSPDSIMKPHFSVSSSLPRSDIIGVNSGIQMMPNMNQISQQRPAQLQSNLEDISFKINGSPPLSKQYYFDGHFQEAIFPKNQSS